MRQKIQLPVVESNVPIPNHTARKSRDGRRTSRPSPWPDFLDMLEVGDSFLLEYPAVATVISYARRLDIPIYKKDVGKGLNGRCLARIWRIAAK